MIAPTTALTRRSLFVYGTLMAPEVMQSLVGRLPPLQAAVLHGYTRHPVVGFCFPGIIKSSSSPSSTVAGLLYTDLTDYELEIMDWFEDVEYTRTNVVVTLCKHNDDNDDDDKNKTNDSKADALPTKLQNHTTAATQVYVWTNPRQELSTTMMWDYERFRRNYLSDYLVHTVQPCRLEFERTTRQQSK